MAKATSESSGQVGQTYGAINQQVAGVAAG